MNRLRLVRLGFLATGVLLIGQLFRIQVLAHGFYGALAEGQHEVFQKLFPARGKIYARDHQSGDQMFLLATNRALNLLYAEPFRVKNPAGTAHVLAPLLGMEEKALLPKLSSPTEQYRVLARKLDDETREKIEVLKLEGVKFKKETFRFYPEGAAGAQVLGFVGESDQGRIGRYGLEGWFDKDLAGSQGSLESERDARGRLIAVGNRAFEPAKDGDDLVLTVDRTVQYVACKKLEEWIKKYGAAKGSLIILDPATGAITAICNAPSFDPNEYGKVDSVEVYNNTATFEPYEPGSVFKAITMAAGLDAGKITPTTPFDDSGEVQIPGSKPIRNSDRKAHGLVDMTTVLNESLNTGVVDVLRRLGSTSLLNYVRDFGFGQKVGIELHSEAAGNIDALSRKNESGPIYGAFGQGITVTVLQLAAAYGAIANDGVLMKPYIVDEVRHADGTSETRTPKMVRRVLSERAARLLSGMLVAVVEKGHGKRAGVSGYWIAGKTGTAEIPSKDGGYEDGATIGSFAGFGPIDDPKFVIVVRIDRPQGVEFAESTAAPLFGDIAKFLLDYYHVPPERA